MKKPFYVAACIIAVIIAGYCNIAADNHDPHPLMQILRDTCQQLGFADVEYSQSETDDAISMVADTEHARIELQLFTKEADARTTFEKQRNLLELLNEFKAGTTINRGDFHGNPAVSLQQGARREFIFVDGRLLASLSGMKSPKEAAEIIHKNRDGTERQATGNGETQPAEPPSEKPDTGTGTTVQDVPAEKTETETTAQQQEGDQQPVAEDGDDESDDETSGSAAASPQEKPKKSGIRIGRPGDKKDKPEQSEDEEQTKKEQKQEQQPEKQQPDEQQEDKQDEGKKEEPPILQVEFTDEFGGSLKNWTTKQTHARLKKGKLYFGGPGEEVITFREPVPLQQVAVEFDGYSEGNGIEVMLQKSEDEFYATALGTAQNSLSLLMDRKAGKPLKICPGSVFTLEEWHHYKFVHIGDRLAAFIDGTEVITATTKRQYEGSGTLRFSAKESTVAIDNLKVFGPAPPPIPCPAPIERAVICEGLDENNEPVGIAKHYPPDTAKLGLYLHIVDPPKNMPLEVRWYHEGDLVQRQLFQASGDSRTVVWVYPPRREYLWTGSYYVEILDNDGLACRKVFEVSKKQ